MVKIVQFVSMFVFIISFTSCKTKLNKVDNNLLIHFNFCEPLKVSFNIDSLFQNIASDSFDVVDYTNIHTKKQLNKEQKSFLFSSYSYAIRKHNDFKVEPLNYSIYTKKEDIIIPIGQFIPSYEDKNIKTLVVLFGRKDIDLKMFKNIVFFNIKNDTLRSICSASESSVKNFWGKTLSTDYSTYFINGIFYIKKYMSNSSYLGIDSYYDHYSKQSIFNKITDSYFWKNLFTKKEKVIYYYTAYFINKNGFIEYYYNVKREDLPNVLKD